MDNDLPRGSETILFVEDEEKIRTAFSVMLEELGYEVLQAGDPDRALQLAEGSEVDLVIMDVVLPGVSGMALAHQITALRPCARILYTSAYASEKVLDERVEGRSRAGFIQKPYTWAEIARVVRDVLDEPRSPSDDAEPVPRGTEAILVVDDDPKARRFMVRSLDRLGYHTLEAHFAERALAIATNARLSLVVMGLRPSEETRLSFGREIEAARPGVRFLLVSGDAPVEFLGIQFPRRGKLHYLKKPFTAEDLGRAARAALDAPLP